MNTTLVKRLGFDAWASNIAVNIIENGDFKDGYRYECKDYSLAITKFGKRYSFSIRAYVEKTGWQTAEIVF